MGFYTAQLDLNNIVKAVTETKAPLSGNEYIQIKSYDVGLLGKRYRGNDKNGDPIFTDKEAK